MLTEKTHRQHPAMTLCAGICFALLLPLPSHAKTSRLLPRDEDDAGIHRLAQVTLLASRRDIVTMGDNYQLLLSAGITDEQLVDGSVVAARVYCCGGPNEKSEEIWAWVPGAVPAALGDVIEVRMGDEDASGGTTAVNAVVAVRATRTQLPGRCRWDPPDETLWARILYCEGVEGEGWKQRKALIYPMWMKRRDAADDGPAAGGAPAPGSTVPDAAGATPSANALSPGIEAFARGDAAAAYASWLPLAESGDATARTLVGSLYLAGSGVARDENRASRWLELAGEHLGDIGFGQVFALWQPRAAAGDAAARYVLGRLYVARGSNAQDYEVGLDWLRQSAAQGFPAADWIIGMCYLDGAGVKRDYKEALKWFRLGADKGDPASAYEIGVMYENGKGVRKDIREALRWHRLAAEGGHREAAHNLAYYLSEGTGVSRETAEGLRWYRVAAAKGYADAANNIGMAYATGEGVGKDVQAAYRWFNLAAYGKFGMGASGPMLKNLEQAASMLDAAQRREAKLAIARMCEEGREVSADPAQAWFWYELLLHDPSDSAWAAAPEAQAVAAQQARIAERLSPATLTRLRAQVRGWAYR